MVCIPSFPPVCITGQLIGLAFPDNIPHRAGGDENFAGQDPARYVSPGQQLLGDNPLQGQESWIGPVPAGTGKTSIIRSTVCVASFVCSVAKTR